MSDRIYFSRWLPEGVDAAMVTKQGVILGLQTTQGDDDETIFILRAAEGETKGEKG